MRKFRLLIILIISAIIIPEFALAERISREKAIQIASDFIKNSSGKNTISPNMMVFRTSEELPNVATKGNINSDPFFYIITNQNGNGFVIVSADSYTAPILGYSLENDLSEIPSNMEKWFMFLRDQIIWAKGKGISDTKSQQKWNQPLKAGSTLKELETALWNQGDPYYLQCPKKGNQYSATGCVATALAEIMRYFQWPKYGNGYTKEYECSDKTISVLSRNLNHEYYWDKMPLKYSSSSKEEEKKAVATLMADIGAGYQLDYSPDGTSGYILDSCLVDNFGYSPNLYVEYRSNYYDYQWIKLLKSEIDKKRPLLYAATDENKKGGHAFVFDGYNDQDYFHVNWGWGGHGNGYFLISALNIDGLKFNNQQEVLFNFYPSDGSTDNPYQGFNLYEPGIECMTTSFATGTPFTIQRIYVINQCSKTYNGNVALMMTDKSGNIIEELAVLDFSNIECIMTSYSIYYETNIPITITKEIKPGYRIRAFHRPKGEQIWYPMWRDGGSEDITQEILVAEDIETPLEEATSLYYNKENKKIIISTLEGVVATLFNKEGAEVTEGITKDNNIITIDLSKLTTDRYRIKLQKNSEIKELDFSVKTVNK